ncbi:cell division protein FtsQ/DivIB [Acidicapsa acidisoli]|uniref:cell division protein FtsQ/DivIB n=1 Tax=Acidicapsa acidisoli TaxID=1615681 RepID=UPI0021DFEF7B|nr:FtsQ-type POTRA domain-containing protein [Acidicapsa acidisoli]
MTSKSYPSRTTLWDDQDPVDPAAPQSRGAWRAPSAVLSGDRGGRRVVSAMPPVAEEDAEIETRGPIPRRAKFAPARTPWWRPRSTFGRVLLGTAMLLVLGSAIAGGVVVRQFLVRDPHFRIPGVSSIQSSGLSEVNRTEILPVFGEDIGRNIFFVPLSQRRKQLESIPWVQQATVMRFLPNRLSVSIVERTPVAFVRQGPQVELADADGVILSMPPVMMAQHHYSFPVITGIDAKDSLASRRARMAVYQRFIAELDQNNQHLTEQVSEIDLSDPEDLRATMPEQGADILAHFGEDQFLHRLQVYKSHIAEWRQRYPKLIGVDLRYNGEVPLEMSNTSNGGDSVSAVSTPSATDPAKPSAQPDQPTTAKTATLTAKATPGKTKEAARKALEAKKKAARLKAAKARLAWEKLAHERAVSQKAANQAAHSNTDSSSQLKQGQ